MKIKSIGKNQTVLTFKSAAMSVYPKHITVFFSYETPVACYIDGQGYFKTREKWSTTTTKHVNKWLESEKAETIHIKDQNFFDNLIAR